ncbi:MAG TPA: phosphoribosylformylglycinamidine synthase subunit PurS [Chitinophagales bacterium]|nr:phosphoribosylformylglycinamidine synthase subunit PurS [Chitinophagales bacterium]HMU68477.1 phosphoribosylformylglycinamidine synthase subunit PurS [Chitinophagales bacterium]HMX04671.1 phosphoribosylformylglycinamidine synthase subunit PurS [Chitinophagales bacterium]HMZ90044.1 phosphoribosylformylglycinamidine synthase subunit PurS [Chitinophagales bacterium]HNA57813.1 phosphoribosylformylglycinamidine synthase subunit PurS [Chitinophagales bacterium]
MAYKAEINVMPLKELLDPKGKAVAGSMNNLSLTAIKDVRIGKRIQLHIEASSASEAKRIAEEACKKLLANPIMESYEISISEG